MQQLQLFETTNKQKIQTWNLSFEIQKVEEDFFIWELVVPSGKYIVKYELSENKKISSFEILDYDGYIYLNVSIIKNIKNLVQAIINRN